MTPKKLPLPVVLLIFVSFAFVAGCADDSATTTLFSPAEVEIKPLHDATGVDDSFLHAALEAMWKNSDGVLMQVFTQTIDCEQGGVFVAKPVGWPDGYEVILTVDPGTIPLNHDKLVDFVIEVPVSGPAEGRHSVPYEFHPDGIVFNQAVHVSMAWPQWAGEAPVSGMMLWYLESEIHDGNEHYKVIDQKLNELEIASTSFNKANGISRGEYSIDHFSRWSVGDGGDGDTGGDGGADHGLAYQTRLTATEGDGCWTSLSRRRIDSVRVDF